MELENMPAGQSKKDELEFARLGVFTYSPQDTGIHEFLGFHAPFSGTDRSRDSHTA